MRFATFVNCEDRETLAVWSDAANGWAALSELLPDEPFSEYDCLNDFFCDEYCYNEPVFDKIRVALAENTGVATLDLENDDDCFAPPVDVPGKILCVGLNYADHAREFGDELPVEPVFFNKLTTALNAHNGTIFLPKTSNRVDFEGELVVVIGKPGKNVRREDAMKHVAGYCCGNDVSARDWQKGKPGGQWLLGKSFDSFAPIGPAFVSADEVGDPNNLKIETRVNGRVMQSSNTSNFIFPIDFLISYVSQVTTLEPGDLIFTGTPNGVGDARKPPIYLQAGDEVVVEIEKIGTLRNIVAADEAIDDDAARPEI